MLADVSVASSRSVHFDSHAQVAVVGGGAAGLIAALRAGSLGAEVVVFERDSVPAGSTALSAGLIPASQTRWQHDDQVHDNHAQFVNDIVAKSGCESDRNLATVATTRVADTLHWLSDQHHIPFSLVDGFTYPGHSARRMHGTPRRTGQELMAALLEAAISQPNIDVLCDARVETLYVNDTDNAPCTIHGIGLIRPDGQRERIGVSVVILACNGYGGNRELLQRHIPSMQDALYFGHAGNTGDALLWGQSMQAATEHLTAFQGHGSVAKPHGVLVTWAVMMEGGIQINQQGRRFSNEHAGYSEQAALVARQPDGIAWNLFDQRIHTIASQFEDYRHAMDIGAIRQASDRAALSDIMQIDVDVLNNTFNDVDSYIDQQQDDPFGRQFSREHRLSAPYYAVRVEGALFHTQGGLVVNDLGRVLDSQDRAFPNLFAAGGAARGVSGTGDSGYLSGNGLLMAVALGDITGEQAARLTR